MQHKKEQILDQKRHIWVFLDRNLKKKLLAYLELAP